jgi:S1/P1 Nuclease/AefR-like transcriptional repressor, C-terminal domain
MMKGGRVPAIARMVIWESRNFPDLARIWHDDVVASVIGIVTRMIARTQARGEVAPGDPRLYAFSLMGPMVRNAPREPSCRLASACFSHPPLPPGILASKGPPRACVVDKVDQFAAELANPAIGDSERLLALKFLLHFVGDLHQPLHAADDHDAGGTKELVTAEGFHPGNLHRYWDIDSA